MDYFLPVKGTSKHQIVVHAELVQPLMEVSLVDETTGSIDNNKREHHPMRENNTPVRVYLL